MGGSQTLSGGSGRGGAPGELSMVTLWFKVGEETVVVQDTFSTLKEIQAAINDTIHKNPRVENTLAYVEGGKLVVKNGAAEDFTLAHWSTAPTSTTSLTLSNRVDGSVASQASPSTVTLDVGEYVDDALSLSIDFVHDPQQSPGVLNIQAQEGRTFAELARLVSDAGASHGITAEAISSGGRGHEYLVLKDLRGRDFDATDMQALARTETTAVEGNPRICTPPSPLHPVPSAAHSQGYGLGFASIQTQHILPDRLFQRATADILPMRADANTSSPWTLSHRDKTELEDPLPPQDIYPQGNFMGQPLPRPRKVWRTDLTNGGDDTLSTTGYVTLEERPAIRVKSSNSKFMNAKPLLQT